MALSESEQISLVQLAMQKVNVVPYEDNGISFGTNVKCVEILENEVSVCECYIDVVETKRTCHVGFSAVLDHSATSTFIVEVDGSKRPKEYLNTNATMQFMDFFLLDRGLHHIEVKAKAESLVNIAPREAKLGVYL